MNVYSSFSYAPILELQSDNSFCQVVITHHITLRFFLLFHRRIAQHPAIPPSDTRKMTDSNSASKPSGRNDYRGYYRGKGKRTDGPQPNDIARASNPTSNLDSHPGPVPGSFMTKAQAQDWFKQIEREDEVKNA